MSSQQVMQCCAVHPERAAVQTCERCGNYACGECIAVSAGSALCTSCEQLVGSSRYHAVPIWRLLLMSALSGGVYQLYWMYKNWKNIQRADRSSIWPFMRALFSGFTYFSLLADLNLFSTTRSDSAPRLSAALGAGYLVTSMCWRLPDPWWVISLCNVVFLVPTARRIWQLSSEQTRSQAARWSVRHSVATVLGLMFSALVLLGLTLDEVE